MLVIAGVRVAEAQSLPPVVFIEPAVETTAPEGYVKFIWAVENGLPKGTVVSFQRGRTKVFSDPVELYSGRDPGTYVSGLVEGRYFFRVRLQSETATGPWSEPVSVEVDYVERSKVIGLMAAGLAVFVITVGAIVGGHLRSPNETA